MKFGVNAFIWTANFRRENLSLLPIIMECGFDGIEIPFFQRSEFDAADIRKGLEENGLECTVCSVMPEGLTIFSEDASVRRKALGHLEDLVKAAAEVGSKLVAGPMYSPVGFLPGRRRTADEWARAVESYQALAPTLASYGVTLAIEPLNRFETFFLNTAADAAALCAEVNHPNIGVLIDTFHANIEEKSIPAAYRTAGRWLKHVHTCENDRGTPGTGHVDWPGVFDALREVQYDGWLTIESFGFALGGISAAASIWRDIEPSPESIAFDGVRFLKQRLAMAAAK
ncbi:MAG TPA: sugar phosphate isomerase/epimerase family protein [Bryobacteraceae bacterium]|nr:sugar phosphate isomerase/epimerase family protein [Bryobacteraceae bacterium]